MNKAKDSSIKCRVTDEMRAQIESYCRKHNISISEFIRLACTEIFATTGVDKLEEETEKARVAKIRAIIEDSKALSRKS